jgi:hypothetical protein
MSRAGPGETGAGVLFLRETSQKPCHGWGEPLDRWPWPLPFANALVDFDFEPLLLVMTQHQLDEQPAEGWS